MGLLPAATTRTDGGTITAASFNSDFAAIKAWADTYPLLTDTARTITAVQTFSVAPVFVTVQAFAAGVTITSGGLAVTAGASTFGAGVTITGTCTATTFSGSGASLTALPAGNLTGALPAISGASLTSLNASNLSSGTVPTGQLPSSYATLTVTTLTATTLTKTNGAHTTTLSLQPDVGGRFLAMDSTNDLVSTTAPTGAGHYYLTLRVGSTDYLIDARQAT